MHHFKLILLAAISASALTACTATETATVAGHATRALNAPTVKAFSNKQPRVVINEEVITQRINTTQCKDADDWYLDGYRVGKSFTSQKEAMFQQRVNYCNGTLSHNEFREIWEKGFKVGLEKA